MTVVPPPPPLNVTPTSLSFAATAESTTPSQAVTISNSGSQPMTWTAQTDGSAWLSIDSTGGKINPGTSQKINVAVSAASLTVGTYTATLTISTNGQSGQITITLTVL